MGASSTNTVGLSAWESEPLKGRDIGVGTGRAWARGQSTTWVSSPITLSPRLATGRPISRGAPLSLVLRPARGSGASGEDHLARALDVHLGFAVAVEEAAVARAVVEVELEALIGDGAIVLIDELNRRHLGLVDLNLVGGLLRRVEEDLGAVELGLRAEAEARPRGFR